MHRTAKAGTKVWVTPTGMNGRGFQGTLVNVSDNGAVCTVRGDNGAMSDYSACSVRIVGRVGGQ